MVSIVFAIEVVNAIKKQKKKLSLLFAIRKFEVYFGFVNKNEYKNATRIAMLYCIVYVYGVHWSLKQINIASMEQISEKIRQINNLISFIYI